MKSEFEKWQDELAGKREHSSWPLVGICLVIVLIAIGVLKHGH